MNRYIVVDLETDTIYSTGDLEKLAKEEFDRFGSSVTCTTKIELLEEVYNQVKEELEIILQKRLKYCEDRDKVCCSIGSEQEIADLQEELEKLRESEII